MSLYVYDDAHCKQEVSNVLSNPNLLINGDFQVWQRGTYFGINQPIQSTALQIYTADRWRIYANTSNKAFKASIQQVKNGLEVYVMSGADISAFTQMIELNKGLAKDLANKTITISFKINNPTGNTFTIKPTLSIVNSNGTYDDYKSTVIVKTGINVYNCVFQMPDDITFYETYPYMRLNLWNIGDTLPLSKFEIFYIKAELSIISTPYIAKNYADELAMCRRYFRIETVTGVLYRQDSGYNYYRLITNNSYRVIPTTHWISADIPYIGDVPIYTSTAINEKGEGVILISTAKAGTANIVNVTVQYDAEIYSTGG